MYSKIVISGSIAYDEIMDFPGLFKDHFLPDKIHQINVSFVLNNLEKQIGGIAVNIAYNLSLLTSKKSVIYGAVGRDGVDIIDFLKIHKITTDAVFVDKKQYTSIGRVITDMKDNQIWAYYYGAAISARQVNIKKYIDNKSLLVVSPTHQDVFLDMLNKVVIMGVDYMFDPGFALSWIKSKDLVRGVRNCKWLIGNDYEIAMIYKKLGADTKKLVASGINVIITLGDQGVWYFDKFNSFKVPSFKIRKPVDPTGAGDAWRGGFLAGIVDRLPIKDALYQANALASFAVEHYGTTNHHPTQSEINGRIKKLKKHV